MRTPTISTAQYFPKDPPDSAEALKQYLFDELMSISAAVSRLTDGHLDKEHVAPAKPRDGDTRYADGTDWNPGHGEGKYVYYNGTWNYQATGTEVDLALANGGGFCPLQVTASSTSRLPLDRRVCDLLSSQTVTANRVYAIPILGGQEYTTDALSIYQGVNLASDSRAAIATDNATGGLHRPGPLLSSDSTLTQTAAGERLHTFTSVTLNPGTRYWLLFTSSTAITARHVQSISVMPWMGNTSHGISPITYLYATYATSLAAVVAAGSWSTGTSDYPSILTRPA